jgi:hypothetical protein
MPLNYSTPLRMRGKNKKALKTTGGTKAYRKRGAGKLETAAKLETAGKLEEIRYSQCNNFFISLMARSQCFEFEFGFENITIFEFLLILLSKTETHYYFMLPYVCLKPELELEAL